MSLRWLSILTAFSAALVVGSPALASPEKFNPPKHYYLALGDSLGFGFQDQKFKNEVATGTYNPATFNTGFVDDFAAHVRTVRPANRVENLACPGETSQTFIDGGCQFHTGFALHVDYPAATPQLNAALAFLRAHPGQVSPITVDLGANDALATLQNC